MSEPASADGRGTPSGTDTASSAGTAAAGNGEDPTGNGSRPSPGEIRQAAATGARDTPSTERQRAEPPGEQNATPPDSYDAGPAGTRGAGSTDGQGAVQPAGQRTHNGRGATPHNGRSVAPVGGRDATAGGGSRIEPAAVALEPAAVALESATLAFGDRVLWRELDLGVARGEFIAVLGPNGSGKTSLLRVLLGQLALSSGRARIGGAEPRAGHPDIGYIPQQRTIDAGVQLRGTDLVGLGVDGHRWGLGLRGRAERRRKVAAAIADVGAERFARSPLESMSGGEQQRLRVAQALVGDPAVLLCDEPLLSLDLASQQLVSGLIDRRRREHGTAVLFVTHEINPILPLVDRVIYLVDGKFRIGTPDEVMTSAVLSELYQTDVDVLRVRGRLVVVGTGDTMDALGTAGAHCHGDPGTPHTPDPAGSGSGRPSRQAHT